MKYAGIIYDDTAAAPGLSLSLYTQGCPFKCEGCHNADLWDFDGGKEYDFAVIDRIIHKLNNNGVLRNFCILGGEPLIEDNLEMLLVTCISAKKAYPELKIYLWTGYTFDELTEIAEQNESLLMLISYLDCLITGRYEKDKRDITLKMRGSSNQEIWEKPEGLGYWIKKE